jgi:pyruvate/oxaloacetate carboxyltransferase
VVGFLDETFRDGPQSLWATRVKTESQLGAMDLMRRAGFEKACVCSGAIFEAAVKFMRDDPWERLRLTRTYMPDVKLDVLMRSRNLFGWSRYPDEVVELLFRTLKRNGVDWIKVFDGLNDVGQIAAHFRIGRALGIKMSGVLTYSISAIHTDEYYAAKAKQLADCGVDSITIVDASGILKGDRTKTLLTAIKAVTGKKRVPIEFYAHHTMGLAHDAYREALISGVEIVTTAAEPLANGDSLPSTLDIARIATELGLKADLDYDVLRRLDDYFTWVAYAENKPVGQRVEYDPIRFERFIAHQIPGGMMSNFKNQLRELGLYHRLDEVLEEAGRVRAELGYPIMVTPFSQFVGVQAVFNVIQGERYKTVPREVILYAQGQYGHSGAPIDPDVFDRILGGKAVEPVDNEAAFGAKILKDFEREHGPFHSDEQRILHLFYGKEHADALAREKTTFEEKPTVKQPLRVLVEELAKQGNLKTFKLERGGLRLSMKFSPAAVA